MKNLTAVALCLALSACSGGGNTTEGGGTPAPAPAPTPAPTPTPAATKPRIILNVLMDDADYQDFGYNSSYAVTPNIDAIGTDGVTLTRAYAAAPMCSPTRASVLTGNYPARYGLNRLWSDRPFEATGDYYRGLRGLPAQDQTIASALKGEGYRTFHIGKWHLGNAEDRFLPAAKGFDRYEIMVLDQLEGNLGVRTESGNRLVSSVWRTTYQAERIITEIDQSLASGQDVYINWWPFEPHGIPSGNSTFFYVPPTFDRQQFDADSGGKSIDLTTDQGKLIAMMHAFDAEFGRIVDHLKQKGVYDDSLVIVTSDNGGVSSIARPGRDLKGSKTTLSEGGIRVPFVASWPSQIPAGSDSDLPFMTTDIYPTIMSLAEASVPTDIAGVDRASVLLQGTGPRRPMFFSFRQTDKRVSLDDKADDSFALIDGCDKIIQEQLQLRYYDVCNDPGERTDLSTSNQARFDELRTMLRNHRVSESTYYSASTVTGPLTFAADDRLNIHHDDLSVYATVSLESAGMTGTHTIYRRGDGVFFRVRNGMLVATVTGVADSSFTPASKTVELSAAMPNDNRFREVALVIRGYVEGGSTIRMYIAGNLVAEAAAPVGPRRDPGQSVLAVKSELFAARLGNDTLPLRNVRLLVNAIEPSEF